MCKKRVFIMATDGRLVEWTGFKIMFSRDTVQWATKFLWSKTEPPSETQTETQTEAETKN